MTCWCLPGTSEMLLSRRWWLSRKNCYRRWNLGPIPPARNQESEQGMAPYLLTETEKILHTTICGKGHADYLLGLTRGNFGELHAQGEYCDQCNICRSPQESPASCNQVQMTWTSEYRCFVATIQNLSFECLPHLPYSSAIFTSLDHSKRRWEASLSGPTKRCSRRCTSGCTLSQKTFFSRGIHALPKDWNTFMEHNGDYVEKWCHCVPYAFNKIRDKKYLRFLFDSPSYKGHCSMEHPYTYNLVNNAPKFLNTTRETKCSVHWRVKPFHEHKNRILSGWKSMWGGLRRSSDKAAWIWYYEQNTYQVILQFWYLTIRNYSARFNKSGTRVSEIYTKSSKWI